MQTHFKGSRTIKNILVKSKDKDSLDTKSGAVYWYQCGELTCNEEYIGETSMTFGERYKEHLKELSPIHGHRNISQHSTNHDNFTIIGREDYGLARTIKESTYIRVNNPTTTGIWVSITFTIYQTESYLLPLILELTMIVVMHTEHPSVGMLRPSQPIGMCIEK